MHKFKRWRIAIAGVLLQQSGNKKPSGFFEPEGFAWNPLPKIAFLGNPMTCRESIHSLH